MTARSLFWVLLIVACGPPGTESAPPRDDPPQVDVGGVSPEAPAFEEQPRMEALRLRTPTELGFSPGTTPWHSFLDTVPSVPESASGLGPGSALVALAGSMGWSDVLDEVAWEETTRIEAEGDGAVGIVLQWGFMDDAVAGRDFRIHLRLTESGWSVVGVERRFHCRRGVSEQGACV